MLVLTRRANESIRVRVPMPDGTHVDIWVAVLDIGQARARLGIAAPANCEILRQEAIRESN